MNLRTLLSVGALVSCIALPGIASAHDMGRGMDHGRQGHAAQYEGRGRFERGGAMRGRFDRGRVEAPRGHESVGWRR